MIQENIIEIINDILSKNIHSKHLNRELCLSNDFIDGFIDYYKNNKDNKHINEIVTITLNYLIDIKKINADKAHLKRLKSVISDIQGDINANINRIYDKINNVSRPLEELSKEELIKIIKNNK